MFLYVGWDFDVLIMLDYLILDENEKSPFFQNASVRSEGGEKVSGHGASSSGSGAAAKRRNSVFVKRGSVSMEPIKKIDLDDVYTVYKQV